jgi:hypothetical protein
MGDQAKREQTDDCRARLVRPSKPMRRSIKIPNNEGFTRACRVGHFTRVKSCQINNRDPETELGDVTCVGAAVDE